VRHPDRPAAALVTNAHLLGPDRRLKVDLPDRRFLSGPMTADPRVDLAVSATAGEEAAVGLRPLDIAGDRPERGDVVVMVGYPGGRRMEARQARVRALVGGRPYGIDGTVVLLDGATALGYSGGPVLDRSGEVVAVLRGYDAATGLIIAIHGHEALELLSADAGVAKRFEPNDSCER
jgi:S1-C subfamily serine protease